MNKLKFFFLILFFLQGCSKNDPKLLGLNEHIQTLRKLEQLQQEIEKTLVLPNSELLEQNTEIKDLGMVNTDCVIGIASYLYEIDVLTEDPTPNLYDTTYYYRAVNEVLENFKTMASNSSVWRINSVSNGYQLTSLYIDYSQHKDAVSIFVSTNFEDATTPDSFPNLDYWATPIYDGKINYVVKAIYFYPSKSACK